MVFQFEMIREKYIVMIGFKCPHYQVEYDVKEKYASIATKRPNCGKEITVPEKDSAKVAELKK